MQSEIVERQRKETVAAYKAGDRLWLYAVLAAAYGIVAVIAVVGSMVVGWIGINQGILGLATAALVALVPAANFYSDAIRTTIGAAGSERQLGAAEDLHAEAHVGRQRLRTIAFVALGLAVILTVGVVSYSVANAGTQEPVNDDRIDFADDDDDEDDEDDEGEKGDDEGEKGDDEGEKGDDEGDEGDDDAPQPGGTQPPEQGGDDPGEQEGGGDD